MRIILTISALLATLAASAANVYISLTPGEGGQVETLLAGRTSVTHLTVIGILDVRDFDYINTSLPDLVSLNLSSATIAGYTGSRTLTGEYNFDANQLPTMALAGINTLTTLKLPTSLTHIGEGALAMTSITELTIPSTITSIGAGAFQGCTRLKSVTVPASVTSVGINLMEGCTSLTDVTWQATIVPDAAMRGCTALTTVTLGSGVTSIGANAFNGCTALTDCGCGNSIASIGDYAFTGCEALELVDLSGCSNLTSIGEYAFAGCTALDELLLSTNLQEVPAGLLFDASAVTKISGLDNVATIGDAAFKGMAAFDNANLGPKAETYGAYSFAYMTNLHALTLPGTLTHIGEHAFEGCTALQELYAFGLYDVPTLDGNPWEGLSQSSISLGVTDEATEDFKNAAVWQNFSMSATYESIISHSDIDADFLKVWRQGSVISIVAGSTIHEVTVHDITGRQCAIVRPGLDSATIDIDGWGRRVVIVTVTTDITRRAVKLSI